MPPRDPSLPEGTDHIIDTNIELGAGDGHVGGGGGSAGPTHAGGTTGGDTGKTGGSTANPTGGATGSSGGGSGGSAFKFDKDSGASGSKASGIMGQVKEQISNLTAQAGDRAKGLADDGKTRATSLLHTLAEVVADAAGSVEDRLGGQYAGFGNKASDSIESFASTLDERSVDQLVQDARAFVQRSPVLAIGIAAVIGFAVARVVRASVSDYRGADEPQGGAGTTTPTAGGAASGGYGNAPAI